jgi:hypothetical protein
MRLMNALGAVGVVTAALVSTAARAEAPPAPAPPCHEQIRQLCGNVEPGGGRMKECVAAHQKDLTPDCQAKITQREDQEQALKAACAQDMKEKCADIVPGKGRMIMCLAAHEPTLSQTCANAIQALPLPVHEGGHGAFRACRDDVRSFCADVKPGGGRIVQCLQTHQAQISPACKTAMTTKTGAPLDEPPPPPEAN